MLLLSVPLAVGILYVVVDVSMVTTSFTCIFDTYSSNYIKLFNLNMTFINDMTLRQFIDTLK
jgi:hypothetical protein